MATPITSLPGIGKATAFALSRHGFRSAEDLAAADEDVLAAVPRFGVSRAARVIKSAQKLIGAPVASPDSSPVAEAEAPQSAETVEPPAKEASMEAFYGHFAFLPLPGRPDPFLLPSSTPPQK